MGEIETILPTSLENFTAWLIRYTKTVSNKSNYDTDDRKIMLQTAQVYPSQTPGRILADIDAVILPPGHPYRPVIRFELLPLDDRRLKVWASCYHDLATQFYMELITDIAKDWPGAFGLGLSEGAAPALPTTGAGEGDEQDTATLLDRTQLHEKIDQHFDYDDLRTLCFKLGIDYDNLSGDKKSGKVRELIRSCEKRNCLDKLVELLRKERPKVPW